MLNLRMLEHLSQKLDKIYRLTRLAKSDLNEITSYYKSNSIKVANDFLDEFMANIYLLENNPFIFQIVKSKFRRAILYRYNHNVFYEVIDKTVIIYRILHQNSNPRKWRD